MGREETFTPLCASGSSEDPQEVSVFGKDDGGEDPTQPNSTGPSLVWALEFSLLWGPPRLSGHPSLLPPMLLAPPQPFLSIHPPGTILGPATLLLPYSSESCLQSLAPVLLHSFISYLFIHALLLTVAEGDALCIQNRFYQLRE